MNAKDNKVIESALSILDKHLKVVEFVASDPDAVTNYLRLKLEQAERETFVIMFLDNAYQLIECSDMFIGTVDQSPVYPREIARKALALNASAVILAHNHPSGMVEPSQADKVITSRIKDSLSLFDISVLDHIIVGQGATCSFAKRGLL